MGFRLALARIGTKELITWPALQAKCKYQQLISQTIKLSVTISHWSIITCQRQVWANNNYSRVTIPENKSCQLMRIDCPWFREVAVEDNLQSSGGRINTLRYLSHIYLQQEDLATHRSQYQWTYVITQRRKLVWFRKVGLFCLTKSTSSSQHPPLSVEIIKNNSPRYPQFRKIWCSSATYPFQTNRRKDLKNLSLQIRLKGWSVHQNRQIRA